MRLLARAKPKTSRFKVELARAPGAICAGPWTSAPTRGEADALIPLPNRPSPHVRRAASARTKSPFRFRNIEAGSRTVHVGPRASQRIGGPLEAGEAPSYNLPQVVNPGSSARFRRVGVIIPARNEAARIGPVLAGIARQVDDVPVISMVVDDGSSDGTDDVARAHGARVITHVINLGKGAAMKRVGAAGLAAACAVLVVMDADGQHRPSDLPAMVGPILSGQADLVLSRRRFTGPMPATARLGNWGLTRLFTIMFGASYADTQCGLRAFTSEAYKHVDWLATGYAVETEMLVRAARAKLRTVEVDIETIYHDAYKGTTMLDGFRILGQMIRLRMSRS